MSMHPAAPRRRRLAVARFWYEGNAFGPLPADIAAFERCEWASGAAALAAAQGTRNGTRRGGGICAATSAMGSRDAALCFGVAGGTDRRRRIRAFRGRTSRRHRRRLRGRRLGRRLSVAARRRDHDAAADARSRPRAPGARTAAGRAARRKLRSARQHGARIGLAARRGIGLPHPSAHRHGRHCRARTRRADTLCRRHAANPARTAQRGRAARKLQHAHQRRSDARARGSGAQRHHRRGTRSRGVRRFSLFGHRPYRRVGVRRQRRPARPARQIRRSVRRKP